MTKGQRVSFTEGIQCAAKPKSMSLLNTAIYYEKTTIHAIAWEYNSWIGNSSNKVISLNAVLQDKREYVSVRHNSLTHVIGALVLEKNINTRLSPTRFQVV